LAQVELLLLWRLIFPLPDQIVFFIQLLQLEVVGVVIVAMVVLVVLEAVELGHLLLAGLQQLVRVALAATEQQ
jgi:hypothetical protein